MPASKEQRETGYWTCPNCKVTKPLDDFAILKSEAKGGRKILCEMCFDTVHGAQTA